MKDLIDSLSSEIAEHTWIVEGLPLLSHDQTKDLARWYLKFKQPNIVAHYHKIRLPEQHTLFPGYGTMRQARRRYRGCELWIDCYHGFSPLAASDQKPFDFVIPLLVYTYKWNDSFLATRKDRILWPLEPEFEVVEAILAAEEAWHRHLMPYDEYLETDWWQERRQQAIKSATPPSGILRCSLCGNPTKHPEIHHNTYARRGFELPTDLIVLCRLCHKNFHCRETPLEPDSE